jgi:predicted N-acetyltransferase YhbS
MPAEIEYARETNLPVHEFIDVLNRSTLGQRRPVHDRERIQRMLANATIVITARADGKVVGVARAISDFSFCCYLSDLAVDVAHQKQGIGKRLIEAVRAAAGPETTLILLAAPAAVAYYPHIGMRAHPSCWILDAHS